MRLTERAELIDRGHRFWNRERTDRPLVGVLFNRMDPLSEYKKTHSEPVIRPSDITDALYVADLERRHAAMEQIGGDAPFVAAPYSGMPWMDAIMGCTVDYSGPSGPQAPSKFRGQPLPTDVHEYKLDSVPWNNGWYDLLLRHTSLAIKTAAGRFPVGPATLGGMGEMCSTLIGKSDFPAMIEEHPHTIRRLSEVFAHVWRRVITAQYELLEPEADGYWNANQPLWAPGKTMFVPADVAGQVPAETFEEFFFEPMKAMLEGFDYCILHTHSSYIDAYPLDLLMGIDQLKAVQVGVDAIGPPVKELTPVFRHILERRALLIVGALRHEDIRHLIMNLPPEGLYILCPHETVDEGKAVLDELGDVAEYVA